MQDAIVEFLFQDGGLVVFGLIAGGLFAVRSVFTFLLWRKGERELFIPFLSYVLVTAALIVASISFITLIFDESAATYIFMTVFFTLVSAAAGGLQIYNFIKNKWFSKEGKA
jgi:hypothetical protein